MPPSSRGFFVVNLLAAGMLTACGLGATPAPKTIKIVTSLPLSGSSESSPAIVNAVNLRLQQAGGTACGGQYKLAYESLDDADPTEKHWVEALEKTNAEKAAADPAVIAYLGPLNSGAAKISIPILNQAGLAMVSMANTYPGLTKPGLGEPDEPEKYYPTGIRNYLRVVVADDVQGAVAANFIQQLGVKSVYLLEDGDLYGVGLVDVFERTAATIGLAVVGRQSIDPKASDYVALMQAIATSNQGQPPDAIYMGMTIDSNSVQLVKDKVAVLGDNTQVKLAGADGFLNDTFLAQAGAAAEGLYASDTSLPVESLPPLGKQFIQDYSAAYGPTSANSTPVSGYEAINVTLKAIENVCAAGGDPTNRKAIRDALFAIQNFQGVLGTWSFDQYGDISLEKLTLYQVVHGVYVVYTK